MPSLLVLSGAALIAAVQATAPHQPQHGGASPLSSPGPTHLESVAFDPARGRLVVYGGSRITEGGPTDLDETWEWDGTRWHVGTAASDKPGRRRGAGFDYDASLRQLVMVGGVRARPGTKDDDALDDTWSYDGARWTRGPDAPVMSGHHLVAMGDTHGLVMLGFAGREVYVPRRLVLWRRTPNAWAVVDSTGPMIGSPIRAAFDAKRSVLVVPVVDDSVARVWEWNGRSWRRIDATGPTRRTRQAVAYDAAGGRVVMMGGRDAASRNPLGDAWAWDGERWTALGLDAQSPGALASATLVSDPRTGNLMLYGGVAPQRGLVADLWVRSGTTWAKRSPPAADAPQGRTPAFSVVRGAFIGVSVGDIEASVQWYTEKLGLAVVMRPPKIEKSTAVILEGGGLIVELMHHEDAAPLRTAAPAIRQNFMVHGIFKAGIVVDDFDRAIAELRARGVPIAIGPFPATAEQRANAIIRDNTGNYLQLFGAR